MGLSWAINCAQARRLVFEAELGEAYLQIKRAFNALDTADAQEDFLDAQQGAIINLMSRFHETSVGRLAA